MKKLFYPLFLLLIMGLTFASCEDPTPDNNDDNKDEKPQLNKTELTLTSTDSFQLEYLNYTEAIEYKTENPYIADVDSLGLIKAYYAGQTTIYANELTCKVTVNPRYTYFLDPYTKWNAKRTDVQEYMKGFEMEYDEENYTEIYIPQEESEYIDSYMYIYENELLTGGAMIVYNLEMESIIDHIIDRYIPTNMDEESGMIMLIDPTMTTQLVIMPYSAEVSLFMYIPAEDLAPEQIRKKARSFSKKETTTTTINFNKYFQIK